MKEDNGAGCPIGMSIGQGAAQLVVTGSLIRISPADENINGGKRLVAFNGSYVIHGKSAAFQKAAHSRKHGGRTHERVSPNRTGICKAEAGGKFVLFQILFRTEKKEGSSVVHGAGIGGIEIPAVLQDTGQPVQQALDEIGAVVEGYYAAANARTLAQKAGVEMPIAQAAYEVLYEGRDPKLVVIDLMGRAKRSELEESWS